jgi:hypothetical protein
MKGRDPAMAEAPVSKPAYRNRQTRPAPDSANHRPAAALSAMSKNSHHDRSSSLTAPAVYSLLKNLLLSTVIFGSEAGRNRRGGTA